MFTMVPRERSCRKSGVVASFQSYQRVMVRIQWVPSFERVPSTVHATRSDNLLRPLCGSQILEDYTEDSEIYV